MSRSPAVLRQLASPWQKAMAATGRDFHKRFAPFKLQGEWSGREGEPAEFIEQLEGKVQ
jgi:hypothetical protein